MKIAVLGANGRSGRMFVAAALAAGHEVTAGVRRHSRFKDQTGLTVVHCDVTELDELCKLVRDQDAIVSLLGHTRGSAADMQTRAMRNLATATTELGPKRVISLTGTGVRFPGDNITLIDRVMNASIALIDPKRIQDGINHVEVLRHSQLEWTVIRVLKLQNTAPRPFRLTEHGPTRVIAGRQDVATAILDVLAHDRFVRQAPMLSAPAASTES